MEVCPVHKNAVSYLHRSSIHSVYFIQLLIPQRGSAHLPAVLAAMIKPEAIENP
jgi:hypothetical protein